MTTAEPNSEDGTAAPAVCIPLDRRVRPLAPECASVGDTVACDVREPYPQTLAMKLETQAAADYATALLKNPRSGWRKMRG